jgi:hypothetical protein
MKKVIINWTIISVFLVLALHICSGTASSEYFMAPLYPASPEFWRAKGLVEECQPGELRLILYNLPSFKNTRDDYDLYSCILKDNESGTLLVAGLFWVPAEEEMSGIYPYEIEINYEEESAVQWDYVYIYREPESHSGEVYSRIKEGCSHQILKGMFVKSECY